MKTGLSFYDYLFCIDDISSLLRRDVFREIHQWTPSETMYGHHAGQCQYMQPLHTHLLLYVSACCHPNGFLAHHGLVDGHNT